MRNVVTGSPRALAEFASNLVLLDADFEFAGGKISIETWTESIEDMVDRRGLVDKLKITIGTREDF